MKYDLDKIELLRKFAWEYAKNNSRLDEYYDAIDELDKLMEDEDEDI